MPSRPPIRYLDAAAVEAAMPPIEERLRLAERTMTGLARDAQLPPKIGVHPRPESTFAHAMPAFLPGADPTGIADLLGMKWVIGFPANKLARLPAISALVVINDPVTGFPVGILDGAPITAQRTAAVSGLAIDRWRPPVTGRPFEAAIVGAGVQAGSHASILAYLAPGVALRIHDRHPDRAEAMAATSRSMHGVGSARACGSTKDAIDGADIVVTAATFGGSPRPEIVPDWLADDALVVAIDYDTVVAASVASDAALFLVDDRAQFLANREAGHFTGYPDPSATIGEAILAETQRPDRGRVLVSHLGVGLADVIFGDAILRRATASGRGLELPV
jgi:ornithine cyclodeaminase/alanine dehydrogenase-like protein (mu-crystallin family)